MTVSGTDGRANRRTNEKYHPGDAGQTTQNKAS